MSLYDENLLKGQQLDISAQWAFSEWMKKCFSQNRLFTIVSARRTRDEQRYLFVKGRDENALQEAFRYKSIPTKEEYDILLSILRNNPSLARSSRVTWTLDSYHLKGLAVDVNPINCSYDDLENIGKEFGITNPIPDDRPHFQFDKCKQAPIIRSFELRVSILQRSISRSTGKAKDRMQAILNRLLKRNNE